MSIGAAAIQNTTHSPLLRWFPPGRAQDPAPVDFEVEFGSTQGDVWAQVQRLLNPSPWRADMPPQGVEAPTEEPVQEWHALSEGVLLPEREYLARFGDLPLNEFKRAMRPEVFDAYVRFVGLIEGSAELDLVEAADLEGD